MFCSGTCKPWLVGGELWQNLLKYANNVNSLTTSVMINRDVMTRVLRFVSVWFVMNWDIFLKRMTRVPESIMGLFESEPSSHFWSGRLRLHFLLLFAKFLQELWKVSALQSTSSKNCYVPLAFQTRDPLHCSPCKNSMTRQQKWNTWHHDATWTRSWCQMNWVKRCNDSDSASNS